VKALKLLIALAALLVVALPAAANAATISYDGSGALNYSAGPGEKNFFGTYNEGGRVAISDSGGGNISFPAGSCEQGWISYVVVCDVPTAMNVSLGDGADIANGDDEFDFAQSIDGGAGADTLRHDAFSPKPITLSGGEGDDIVTGGAGPDVLNGGGGVDEITGRDSTDQLNGGPGDDKLLGDSVNVDPAADVIDGGDGFDTVAGDWGKNSDSRGPINITLAGGADDGRPGEGDDLRGVEHVVTNYNGTYTGSEGADDIDINQVTEASTVNGLGGNDRLDLSDANDTVDGGAGADHIEGGYGNDTITGGPGQDELNGDEPQGECSYIYCKPPAGNDTINARDGEVDQVDCGVGPGDVANVDAIDNVQGCETVNKSGSTTGPGGNDNGVPGDNGVGPNASALTVRIGKVKLAKALKSGVTVNVTTPGAGKVTLTAKRGSKVVATGSGQAGADGAAKLKLKFTKAGRKALKRARSAKLTVAVTYKPASGDAVKSQVKLTLKR
jgi:Ca2+-binding RTX toxin-like protein